MLIIQLIPIMIQKQKYMKKTNLNIFSIYIIIMTSLYTEAHKKATYKWRDKNREKKRASDLKYLHWKKVKFEFLNILLII